MQNEATAIKPPVELAYEKQLAALSIYDKNNKKPKGWRLSPIAVRAFVIGLPKPIELEGEKVEIDKKYYGDDPMVERAIITLAGNRGLMLVGEPGTAKTMLSELFSAAISGTSTNTVQGTAGTTDDDIKYSWNYAMLIAKGPCEEALVPAPLYTGMKEGLITRFEEITRCPSEVQDTLISVMSDKVLNIPEFGESGFLFAREGFNIVATANTRDKGVNEMSSALKRRFNFETVSPVPTAKLEMEIIAKQAKDLLKNQAPEAIIDEDIIGLLATVFHELREGVSSEGQKIESPASALSTAEAVSLYCQSALSSYYYGEGLSIDTLVQNIRSAVLKESDADLPRLRNYWSAVVKKRSSTSRNWKKFYEAGKWIR
ncbi:MAG: AAA family ATPase [Eubacteriaceae bacterium]|nr:AAA family ATPase [Eubacteriaceae bacterium]